MNLPVPIEIPISPPGEETSSRSSLVALGVPKRQHGVLLCQLFPFLEAGGQVYCLDAGNVFDPSLLAQEARKRGMAAEPLLERMFVSRAATCHQVVSVVEEMLLPLARNPAGKAVAVLSLDTLFLDEDIPPFERTYLFRRTLLGIACVRSSGIRTLVTHNPELSREPSQRGWHRMIEQILKPTSPPGPLSAVQRGGAESPLSVSRGGDSGVGFAETATSPPGPLSAVQRGGVESPLSVPRGGDSGVGFAVRRRGRKDFFP